MRRKRDPPSNGEEKKGTRRCGYREAKKITYSDVTPASNPQPRGECEADPDSDKEKQRQHESLGVFTQQREPEKKGERVGRGGDRSVDDARRGSAVLAEESEQSDHGLQWGLTRLTRMVTTLRTFAMYGRGVAKETDDGSGLLCPSLPRVPWSLSLEGFATYGRAGEGNR